MFIVASGPSAAGFIAPDGVTVICVNGVVGWINRADYWFTLDCDRRNLRRCFRPRCSIQYVAAVPGRYALPSHVHRFHRVSAPGLSKHRGVIHSGNSAFGAVGLAYHLGARRVALIGVDGTNETRVEGGKSGDLSHLPALFESALGQIEIVNCGKLDSDLIPRMTVSEAIEWMR